MNNQNLEHAFSIHRSTLMSNLLLKPIEGTVLDEIVSQAPAFYKDIDSSVAAAADSKAPYDAVQTAVTNVSQHLSSYQEVFESGTKLAIDEKAAEVAQVVQQHLEFVKNVANPICKDFVQNYNDLTAEPLDPAADFTLTKLKSNPIFHNSSWVQSMIQEYDNALGEKKQYPNGHFPLPVMTFPQVCEVIIRHFSDTTTEIFEYLQSLGGDVVMTHLAQTFNWPTPEGKPAMPTVRDSDTVMYLFASAMYDNPVQGTEHILGNYNDRMKSYIIACGYALVKYHLKEYIASLTNEQIITRISAKVIYLNEVMYNKFIADGGDDIRLLGFVVSKEHANMSTIAELKEKASMYEGVWSKYVIAKKNEYDIKASNRARQVYMFLAEKIIKENGSVIKDFCTATNCDEENVIKHYYVCVKNNQLRYPEHMLTEPQRMVMELMGYLFPGSSVKPIYSISLDVESSNPEYTPQEIWQVTAYRYICQYYFDQICVCRK